MGVEPAGPRSGHRDGRACRPTRGWRGPQAATKGPGPVAHAAVTVQRQVCRWAGASCPRPRPGAFSLCCVCGPPSASAGLLQSCACLTVQVLPQPCSPHAAHECPLAPRG